ncbi:hypothetical protein ABEB36_002800 [Hypothenemus hampei]|uniref:DUF243 domain-containing protein n=1 Tax=Hypothenemus hampei TaxID=57062 RepID=A0ABD1F9N8_HYPHA
MRHLVLLGFLAVTKASTEGYNYLQPQPSVELGRNQQTISSQQNLHLAPQPSNAFTTSYSQQQPTNYPQPQPTNYPQPQLTSYSQQQPPIGQTFNFPAAPVFQAQLQQTRIQQNPVPVPQQPISFSQIPSGYQQFVEQQPSRFTIPLNYAAPQLLQILPQIPNPNQFLIPNIQLTQNSIPENSPQPLITNEQTGFIPQQGSLVTKHVYVHVAPEEPPLPPQVIPAPVAPRRTYRIIFIKAPTVASPRPVIHVPAPQPPAEEKTLVYVLVDKPQQPQIVVPAPAPAQPSKPEVYFIKYKANGNEVPATPSTQVRNGEQQPVSSGESTSSLFSGDLNSKYAPAGYQKRNSQ